MFLQDDLLARVATTSSNAYHIKPMNSSLTLLKETVKYLGKEWCSGMYVFIFLQETNSIGSVKQKKVNLLIFLNRQFKHVFWSH